MMATGELPERAGYSACFPSIHDPYQAPADPSRVLAVLGPTNTGKTHFAVERMLAHPSGLIGFPLRLLAREIYDRIVQAKGPGAVALITGEERIQPPTARFHVATVEAMPLDRLVGFDGRPLKDVSHVRSRLLTRKEIIRILRAEVK